MQGMHIRMLRRLKKRTLHRIRGPGDGAVGSCRVCNRWKGQAGPGCSGTLCGQGPSVERLEDGREGFIITEVPQMDEASRRDFERAVAMLNDQEYGQAIDLLEKVIEQSPGVTAPYIDIAIAYQHIGKLEQAEEHLKTALRLVPEHPVACNEYGLLYRKTGRFAEAREIYEKVLLVFPDYYPVHRNLGILCDLYLNDPACALEHYEIYSEARPEDKQGQNRGSRICAPGLDAIKEERRCIEN